VFLFKKENIAPEVPLTLKEALYERLRLEKRFYLDQEKYTEYETTTKEAISDIERKQRLLNEELYEVLDIFSSNVVKGVHASDSEMILGEKENRLKCNQLSDCKKKLESELESAERDYHAKCAELKRAIERYNARNCDDLDDEYVLGIKGWDSLKELVDSIIPAEEADFCPPPSEEANWRKKFGNNFTQFFKEMFSFKKV